jgi:hypothetical protein
MKQNLSPEQLAENKAKLMAQVDSLHTYSIPEEVETDMVHKALQIYLVVKPVFERGGNLPLVEACNDAICRTTDLLSDKELDYNPDFVTNQVYNLTQISNLVAHITHYMQH